MSLSKKFVDEAIKDAKEIDRNPLTSVVVHGLEEDVADGLKALARLWFLEFTDENDLPAEFHHLVELIQRWNIADLDDFEDEEDAAVVHG